MNKIFLLLLPFMLFSDISYASEYMVKGSKAYEKQKFQTAIEEFSKARTNDPEDAKANYNLASAYYKAGQYDKALGYYDAALNNTQDSNLKSAVLYNMGNCAYKSGDKDLALNYYKSSFKLNSSDMQAKHNIEFIQKEDNQNNKDNKDNGGKNNRQNKDKQNKQEKKDGTGDKEQNRQQRDKDDKKEKNNENNEKKGQDKKKEQQESNQYLLDYFDSQDKQNHDKAKDGLAIQKSETGKNW